MDWVCLDLTIVAIGWVFCQSLHGICKTCLEHGVGNQSEA